MDGFRRLAIGCALCLTACSQSSRPEWLSRLILREPARADAPPAPAIAPDAPAVIAAPDDDVEQRVNAYTQAFEPDDFNSKIARQAAPRSTGATRARLQPPAETGIDDAVAESPPRPVRRVPRPEPIRIEPQSPSDRPVAAEADTQPPSSLAQADPPPSDSSPPDRRDQRATASGAAPPAITIDDPAAPAAAPIPTPALVAEPTSPSPPARQTAPRVRSLSVAADASGPSTAITIDPGPALPQRSSDPRATTPMGASTSGSSVLGDLEAAVAGSPNDLDKQMRLRMMYVALGQDGKALAETPGMSRDVLETVQGLIRPLIAARTADPGDPARAAARQLAAVEQLQQNLRSRAELSIPAMALCSQIDTFGRYDAIEPPALPVRSRATYWLYVEVANYRSEQTARGDYRTLLTMRTSLLTRDGREVWTRTDRQIEDLSRRPRADFFLSLPFTLPDTVEPGEYVLKAEIEDELGGKANSRALDIRVVSTAESTRATADRGAR